MEGAYGKITLELTIYVVEQSDYGSYQCRVDNTFGSGSATVELVGQCQSLG